MIDLRPQIKEIDDKLAEIKRRVDQLDRKTLNVTGDPIIQGYAGMRLTLNASLNVLELIKRMRDLSDAALTNAQTYTDTTKTETDADLTAINASIAALATAVFNLETALGDLFDNCTANTVLRFDGTGLDDSSITDTGTLVTVGAPLATSSSVTSHSVRVATTPYTVLASDHVIFFDTDVAAITANLPAGTQGRKLTLKNCGANDLTMTPNGAELLDGANASKAMSRGTLDLVYDTTEGWR